MSGVVLLLIGLGSLVLVLAALGYLAWSGWIFVKHGRVFVRRVRPIADGLAAASGTMQERTGSLEAHAAQVNVHLDRLRADVVRLQILVQALNEGFAPYRRLRDYIGK
jgi:hypothetical protein